MSRFGRKGWGSLREQHQRVVGGATLPSPDSSCALPAPVPVIITSCTSTSGGYGVVLTWPCPLGGSEAFRLEVGGQQSSWDGSSCRTDASAAMSATVWGLQPARSYSATVTTLWDGLAALSAPVTCHTDSAGEQGPGGQSWAAQSLPVKARTDSVRAQDMQGLRPQRLRVQSLVPPYARSELCSGLSHDKLINKSFGTRQWCAQSITYATTCKDPGSSP